jgi:imidazolonepropionase-like amidohydrolase
MRTKFVFTPEFDEVTAVFVDSVWPNGLIDMYAHIGQHGSGSREWCLEQPSATPEQYAPLLAELQAIGYAVVIV